MTPTKALFHRQTELRNKLFALSKEDWFEQAMLYAKQETMATNTAIGPEFHMGIERFAYTLMTLADLEPDVADLPGSGINHSFDTPKKESKKP